MIKHPTVNDLLILDSEDEIHRHVCNWKDYGSEVAGTIPGTQGKKIRLRDFILPGKKGYQFAKKNGNVFDFRKENIRLDKVDKGLRASKVRNRNYKRWVENKEVLLNKSKERRANRNSEQREVDRIRNRLQKRSQYQKINTRIADRLRGTFGRALKRNFKQSSAVRDLGCTIEEFKSYIESKFYVRKSTGEIMSWDNYGSEWHLDHVKPLSSFDLSDKDQQLEAVNYTNLQPLWKEDNLSKGSKF
jgi:hypothetical protein